MKKKKLLIVGDISQGFIDELKDEYELEFVNEDKIKICNDMYIVPNELFYIEQPTYEYDKEEFLKFKIKQETNKIKQKSGINVHQSKKNKTYF